jgi:hypothetical protein
MIIRYIQKKEGNAVLLSFFLRSLRAEYKYIEKKEKGKKKSTLLTLSIFFCVELLLERQKKEKKKKKKKIEIRESCCREVHFG